jgi:hypothetical protein
MNALLLAAAYVFVPVVIPGASYFNFFGPNDKGQILVDIVGNAVLGFQLLKVPGATTSNTTFCEGINNRGQVTCAFTDDDFHSHVFIGSPRDGGDDQEKQDSR